MADGQTKQAWKERQQRRIGIAQAEFSAAKKHLLDVAEVYDDSFDHGLKLVRAARAYQKALTALQSVKKE